MLFAFVCLLISHYRARFVGNAIYYRT